VTQSQNNRIFTHILGLAVSWEKGEFVKWWAGRDDFASGWFVSVSCRVPTFHITQQASINVQRDSLIPNQTVKQAALLLKDKGLHIIIVNRRQDVQSFCQLMSDLHSNMLTYLNQHRAAMAAWTV